MTGLKALSSFHVSAQGLYTIKTIDYNRTCGELVSRSPQFLALDSTSFAFLFRRKILRIQAPKRCVIPIDLLRTCTSLFEPTRCPSFPHLP